MYIQTDASLKTARYMQYIKNFYCNLGFLILKFDIKVCFIRSVEQKISFISFLKSMGT